MKIAFIILVVIIIIICISKYKKQNAYLESQKLDAAEERKLNESCHFWYSKYMECRADYEKKGDNLSRSLMENAKREYELALKRRNEYD